MAVGAADGGGQRRRGFVQGQPVAIGHRRRARSRAEGVRRGAAQTAAGSGRGSGGGGGAGGRGELRAGPPDKLDPPSALWATFLESLDALRLRGGDALLTTPREPQAGGMASAAQSPRDWNLAQRKARFTVGIDFGNSFSGYAFAANSDENVVTVKCVSASGRAPPRRGARARIIGSCLLRESSRTPEQCSCSQPQRVMQAVQE